MMGMSGRLRMPFLVTVSVSALACGGEVVLQEGAGGGASTSTSSAGGSIGTTGVSASSGEPSTGTGTVNPPPPACPPEAPDAYTSCDLEPGQTCTYDVSCQSGLRTLSFRCGALGLYEFADQACEVPYDSCPGTEYYCDGTWWMPNSTNPPSPCPQDAPMGGDACLVGEMGGDWPYCGYACDGVDASNGWTVLSCVGPDGDQQWFTDGACFTN